MENNPYNSEELRYQQAAKRVKKIKGFYMHLLVFVFVNIFIYVANVRASHGDYLALRNFSTAFFWGIGLAAHGFSVFMPAFILSKEWEDRKINELMEKEKNNKWE